MPLLDTSETGVSVMPTAQIRKLRHGLPCLTQKQNQNLNPKPLAPEPIACGLSTIKVALAKSVASHYPDWNTAR